METSGSIRLRKGKREACCSPKPSPKERPLLPGEQARRLALLFKLLANDTRLRLLHAVVRADEIRVGDLARELGLKAQAVSNQLQRLSNAGILTSRREGKNIAYRLVDPCAMALLDQGLCLLEDASSRSTATVRIGVVSRS